MRLQDKVAIITGGAGKIGSHYAQGMAREGAKVCLADRVSGGPVVEAIEREGGEAVSLECDVSDERSVQAMVDAAARRFGGIDILVNNAAYFHPFIQRGLFWEIDVEDFDKAMAINVRGPWLCARAVFPYMRERGKGKIINISSGQALQGGENYIHYVASKGAVISMTRAMARELGDYNICVNTIAPGFVTTSGRQVDPERQRRMDERRCLKRPQVEDDLVGTAVFLASADSDFMTGQLLLVDGGAGFV
jgi:NAD(P)-dependent dehydrogenase (short-subunit alcohol dehydrogenase family)